MPKWVITSGSKVRVDKEAVTDKLVKEANEQAKMAKKISIASIGLSLLALVLSLGY